ncbi:MAG: ComEC/Rec2 family competence protein [Alphaproteobacteria bacterium]|nr:ComEC/Rec2 family competence protein [Alphaproteobacteria bacterium]
MDRFAGVGVGVVLGVTAWPWCPVDVEVALAVGLVALAARLLLARLQARGVRATELAIGLGLGLLAVASVPQGPRLRGPMALQGVVVGAPLGRAVDVEAAWWTSPGGVGHPTAGRVRVLLPWGARVSPGQTIVVFGLARPVEAGGPPGGPDAVRAAMRSRVRTQLAASVVRATGPTPPAPDPRLPGLLRALATGDRSGVTDEDQAVLRRTGTSHLLAISGFHVGLVAAALAGLVAVPRGLVTLVRPEGVDGRMVHVAGAAGAVGFAWAVGAPVSAQRAATMVVLASGALMTGRRLKGLSVLGLVATLVLVADPAAVGGPSFQLSFGAVAGLLTWGRAMARRVPPDLPWPLAWLAQGLIATLAATVGTLPAAAWWFQAVAPLGPVANVFAMPYTAFVLVPLAFAGVLAPDPIAGWAADLGQPATSLFLLVLGWCDVDPWRPAVGPLGALLLCGLFVGARRPLLSAVGVALVLWRPWPAPVVPSVTFPDVGQGACALVRRADGQVWLVDGGTPWSGAAAWLRRARVRHLDAVVASHADADHAGGIVDVLDTIDVDVLYVADDDDLDALLAVAAHRDVPVVFGPPDRLWPPPGGADGPRNDGSVVLALGSADDRVVLPGDVGDAVERRLAGDVGGVAVLALAHHGSRTSSDPAWLDALHPGLAVAQAGRRNRYGHPDPVVVGRLVARGIPLLRSDLHGTITVALDGSGRVWSHRQGVGWRTLPALTPSARPVGGPAPATPPPPPPQSPPRSPATSTATGRSGSSGRGRRGRTPPRSAGPRSPRGRAAGSGRRSACGARTRSTPRTGRTARRPRTAGWGAGRRRAGPPTAGR